MKHNAEVKAQFGQSVLDAAISALGERWHLIGFNKKEVFVGNDEKNIALDRKTAKVLTTFNKKKVAKKKQVSRGVR